MLSHIFYKKPSGIKYFLGYFFCALVLSACQDFKTHKPATTSFSFSSEWMQRQLDLEQSNQWQTLGKLGVKTEHDGGSASLTWQQKLSDLQIDLVGPMGQGRLSLTSNAGEFTLIEAGKPPISAASAEALLLKTTGWKVPVAELSFWIRALPDPGHPVDSTVTNASGQLSEMKQLGWQINYSDYLPVNLGNGQSQPMPGRIIAQYTRAPTIKLTLVVRAWKFGNEKLGAQP